MSRHESAIWVLLRFLEFLVLKLIQRPFVPVDGRTALSAPARARRALWWCPIEAAYPGKRHRIGRYCCSGSRRVCRTLMRSNRCCWSTQSLSTGRGRHSGRRCRCAVPLVVTFSVSTASPQTRQQVNQRSFFSFPRCSLTAEEHNNVTYLVLNSCHC